MRAENTSTITHEIEPNPPAGLSGSLKVEITEAGYIDQSTKISAAKSGSGIPSCALTEGY